MNLASFELVIFDCDGVLVDSERIMAAIDARLLTELGWPMTPDEVVASFLGRSFRDQLAEVAARLGPEAARRFEVESDRAMYQAFGRELTAVPGVVPLLDALDAIGMRTCVASSGSHEKMRMTLGVTGLFDRFAGRIFSATEVARGKPAPDLFLHAAARMGVAPARAAVIEDSVAGVKAAAAAGMTAFGFGGGLSSAQALQDAGATVFSGFAELRVQRA